MNLKIIFVIFCFFYAAITYSMPKPERCPSGADLRSVGIKYSEVFEIFMGRWETRSISQFNTNNYWYFDIARIDANNHNEAYQKAKDALGTLILTSGPTWYPPPVEHWMCNYFVWPMSLLVRVMADSPLA